MRISSRPTLALGLVLTCMNSIPAAASCDPTWTGTGITAAPSEKGHIVALRGLDGIIRINEWSTASKIWSGWMAPSDQIGVASDPWIQSAVSGAHNLYARSNTGVTLQWVCYRKSDGSLDIVTSGHIPNAGSSTDRLASAQMNDAGEQRVFARFADGTIKSRTYKLNDFVYYTMNWDNDWTDLGITNVVGSPWTTQVTSSTVNLFVRLTDGSIRQRYWNGSSWSTWLTVPTSFAAASDPASYFDGTAHYLDYIGTDSIPVQMIYYRGWTSSRLTNFPAKSSTLPFIAENITYGIDANHKVIKYSRNASGAMTTTDVGCESP